MGTNDELRRDFRVRGRVQGVGFRWWASRRAEELGLRGAVRNLPDGAVELCAEGSPEALELLASWLQRGPPGARVDALEEVRSGLAMPVSGFRIAR